MHSRRKGCPQPRIRAGDYGQIECVTGLFSVLILAVVVYSQLQLAAWRSTSDYLEDTLAASNLAAALIDVGEYGSSHKVKISDEAAAYEIFLEAVRDNLQLNDEWECVNHTLIAGPVEVADFVIYNVDISSVKATRVGAGGRVLERWSGVRGHLRAPNGVTVEHTGIYSELQFPVRGFPGVEVQAHKGKLIDIVSLKGEEDETK